MYEEFYGLTEKPFSIQPDPSFLYWGRSHRLAYAMLEYGVLNHAGISIVTGEVGCGKTTLVHRLLEQLSDSHTVALLSNIQRDRGDLLSWVLMGFGQPFNDKDHVEKFADLQRYFISEYNQGRKLVLIIDEAQNLSIDMLEEIRMLSNINAGKHQLLQLILIGQPQLKELLNRPDLLQLAQRVGADFHLTPLNRDEVHAYIDTRLAIAGAKRAIFSPSAIDRIAAESRGVPRVINIIADTALVYGFSGEDNVIGEDVIAAVIKDKGSYGVFGIASDADLTLQTAAPEESEDHADSIVVEPSTVSPSEGASLSHAAGAVEEKSVAAAAAPGLRDVSTAATFASASVDASVVPADETLFPDLVKPIDARLAPSWPVSKPVAPAPAAPAEPVSEATPRPTSEAAPSPIDDPLSNASPHRATQPVTQPVASIEAPAEDLSAPSVGVIVVDLGDVRIEDESRLGLDSQAPIVLVRRGLGGAVDSDENDGVELVELASPTLTFGRACNAGYRRMKKIHPDLQFVQFVVAGASIEPGWLAEAANFLSRRPEVSAISGKVIRSLDESGFLGRLRAMDWEKSEGEAQTTDTTFCVRTKAFEAAGGFRGDLPLVETADLCIRLRRRGAHVWRLPETMASMPTGVKSLGSWFGACMRDGKHYAMGVSAHGAAPDRYCVGKQTKAIFWGAIIPLVTIALTGAAGVFAVNSTELTMVLLAIGAAIGVLVFACLMKVAFMAVGRGVFRPSSWVYGFLKTAGHIAEFFGVLSGWRMLAKSRRDSQERAGHVGP